MGASVSSSAEPQVDPAEAIKTIQRKTDYGLGLCVAVFIAALAMIAIYVETKSDIGPAGANGFDVIAVPNLSVEWEEGGGSQITGESADEIQVFTVNAGNVSYTETTGLVTLDILLKLANGVTPNDSWVQVKILALQQFFPKSIDTLVQPSLVSISTSGPIIQLVNASMDGRTALDVRLQTNDEKADDPAHVFLTYQFTFVQ